MSIKDRLLVYPLYFMFLNTYNTLGEVMRRGDIYYADLGETIGSEQAGVRPVVIVQNNVGNKYSNTVIVIPITSSIKKNLPTHVNISGYKHGLEKDSVILAEQIRTIDKSRLIIKVGSLDKKVIDDIKQALIISCGLRGKVTFKEFLFYINNIYKK